MAVINTCGDQQKIDNQKLKVVFYSRLTLLHADPILTVSNVWTYFHVLYKQTNGKQCIGIFSCTIQIFNLDPHVRQIFFRWDSVKKMFLRPFSPFRWFKKGSCQLMAKEWALSTGKLPWRLAQELGVARITDRAWNDLKCVEVKHQHNNNNNKYSTMRTW